MRTEVIYDGEFPDSVKGYYSLMGREHRSCCLYELWDSDGSLIYVGISYRPGNRFDRHRKQWWWPLVSSVTVTSFVGESRLESRWRAKSTESRIIREMRPLANRAEKPIGVRA